jgi:predicted  nucleic acid-binding Zn-ribbon protein
LVNDIEARKNKISILEKTAFHIELDCKRKEQQVQKLTDKKNRLEKLIRNVINDDDNYSNLKRIIKENAAIIIIIIDIQLRTIQST